MLTAVLLRCVCPLMTLGTGTLLSGLLQNLQESSDRDSSGTGALAMAFRYWHFLSAYYYYYYYYYY